MTVRLTSPVEGKQPGEEYTGSNEDWLLANGYATREGYDGPGVSNSGPADVEPEKRPGTPKRRRTTKASEKPEQTPANEGEDAKVEGSKKS